MADGVLLAGPRLASHRLGGVENLLSSKENLNKSSSATGKRAALGDSNVNKPASSQGPAAGKSLALKDISNVSKSSSGKSGKSGSGAVKKPALTLQVVQPAVKQQQQVHAKAAESFVQSIADDDGIDFDVEYAPPSPPPSDVVGFGHPPALLTVDSFVSYMANIPAPPSTDWGVDDYYANTDAALDAEAAAKMDSRAAQVYALLDDY